MQRSEVRGQRSWKRTLTLLFVACLVAACAGPEHAIDVTTLKELPADPYVYTLSPGDELRVEIAEDEKYDWRTTVLPDGSATFRWAGHFNVMGLTLVQMRDQLKEKLKPYFTRATMTISLSRVGGPPPIVYLGNFGGAAASSLGAQRSTGGTIAYRKGMGVIEAIALAGGPGEPDIDVAPYVYVVRNMQSIQNRQVYRFDMAAAVRGESPDLPLHPGDVFFLDQSWLQDLERALGITSRLVGSASQGLGAALFVDALADGAFGN